METDAKYITGEELISRVNKRIDRIPEKREQIITQDDIKNSISGKELIAAVCERIDKFADKK